MDARWKPMLCETADAMPQYPESWIIEPKFDGWRTLVVIEPAGVTVIGGRNEKTYSGKVPYIEAALAGALPPGTVVDGELIHPDGWGGVQSAMTTSGAHAPGARSAALTLVVFDVLQINGRDVRALPWENRHQLLEMVDWPAHTCMAPSGPATEGAHVRMLDLGMEGSVIKLRDSRYESGRRSRSWQKLKAIASEDCRIVGFEDGKGGRTGEIGAIVVELPSGVRTTASGMTDKVRADMLANWSTKYLGQVVEIAHNGEMSSGKLRHPRFKRMRDDRSPTPAPRPASSGRAKRMRNYKAMGDAKLLDCIRELEEQRFGAAHDRALDDDNYSVAEHLAAAHDAARAKGLQSSTRR